MDREDDRKGDDRELDIFLRRVPRRLQSTEKFENVIRSYCVQRTELSKSAGNEFHGKMSRRSLEITALETRFQFFGFGTEKQK